MSNKPTRIRRLIAPNPSMMTGPGTNTWLLGEREVAVIDPGPPIREHIETIAAEAGAPIRWILATHTHPDHSPGVALLKQMTGAEVLGMRAPEGDHQDQTFSPDRELRDNDVLKTAEYEVVAIHTPGHASNHLCYQLLPDNVVVTGDHVIEGSTVVINPPDGDMAAYLASLKRVRDLEPVALLPGHGDRIDQPTKAIDWIIEHRLERESRVLAAVRAHPGLTTRELVVHVYKDVPAKLHAWAERSLLAHLLKLAGDGVVSETGERWHSREDRQAH